MCLSNASDVTSTNDWRRLMPAALTRMSSAPRFSEASAMASALGEIARDRVAATARRSGVRHAVAPLRPARACAAPPAPPRRPPRPSARRHGSPMPELPPVTSATRPLRSNSCAIDAARQALDRHAAVEALAAGNISCSRSSAVRACASMPSSREMRAVTCADLAAASRVMRCQVSVLMNLCTDRPPE